MTEYAEITLIQKSHAQDCIGQPVGKDEETKVVPFAVGSVNRNEWSTAMQGGYEAEIMGTVFTASYSGEKQAIFHGIRYEIYRSFRNGDRTELYLGTQVGVN